jgi:hypothetical protein
MVVDDDYLIGTAPAGDLDLPDPVVWDAFCSKSQQIDEHHAVIVHFHFDR